MKFKVLLVSLIVGSLGFAQALAANGVASPTVPAKKSSWASAITTPGDIFNLLQSGDMERILETEAEIGFTQRRLGDGRYLQQHWAVALASFAKEHNKPADLISSAWLKDKGMNSYACPLRVSVLYNQAVSCAWYGICRYRHRTRRVDYAVEVRRSR